MYTIGPINYAPPVILLLLLLQLLLATATTRHAVVTLLSTCLRNIPTREAAQTTALLSRNA